MTLRLRRYHPPRPATMTSRMKHPIVTPVIDVESRGGSELVERAHRVQAGMAKVHGSG